MKATARRILGVAAVCICMGCTGGVLDLGDIDIGSWGDINIGEGDVAVTDLPVPESVEGECQSNDDCAGKFADLGPCELALCDAAQQVCVVGAIKDYTLCDDGDACTVESYCMQGDCTGGQMVTCDDANDCTLDSCDPAMGCVSEPLDGPCDDGNACTSDDACTEGECVGVPGACPCEADTDCPTDSGTLCETHIMACVEGSCVMTETFEVVCDSAGDNPCVNEFCDDATGECVIENVTGNCSDGSTCTVGDQCQAGVCVPGDNMCDCAIDDDCLGFDDGDLCNGTLACVEGKCATDPTTVVTCSQMGLADCEKNVCVPETGTCQLSAKADGVACDDGDVCTDMDACQAGACVGAALSCFDDNPCTEDSCDPAGGCVNTPLSDVTCDDGDECTDGEMCLDGECVGGENVCGECGDGNCDANETCDTCPDDCGICGDCCEIQEGPGCGDEETQACVCALDAFCCETLWDNICVDEAVAECGLVCGPIPECGDGDCNGDENCDSCPEDCGACGICGDGQCGDFESCEDCPDDCGVCVVCGDGECVEPEGCFDCPEDCGECATCGDGECDALESCKLCPEDCGACAFCGDDNCDDDEDCKSCPDDCGDCCGNGACEALLGEDCHTCEIDCGLCPAECGDGECGDDENCAVCADDCGSCEGSCCIPKETVGCADLAVQQCVCAADEFCCTIAWDDLCAAQADECGSCNGDCCESHPTPGCADQEIEACVCAEDPFCCDTAWDGLCVAQVTDLQCGVCEIVAECGDGECNGEEDCKSCPDDCGECCGNGACEALFGETCETCAIDCGECPADCGNGVCDDGESCVNCADDCGGCKGSCCLANGTPGCMDANIQACVCALDPYCCNNQWDGICAAEADDCGGCNGDCCAVNGNEGCDDEPVEACVCAQDAFCCDVNWDQLCVNEVESLECGSCVVDVCGDGVCGETETCENCANDCGECLGSCCEVHEGTGCADAECAAYICEMDPFCCEDSWDDICAGEAAEFCPVCGGAFPFCGDDICGDDEDCATCPEDCGACESDCCSPHAGVGCDDADCSDYICELDPFCCEEEWDDLCAGAAADFCPACGGDFPFCGDDACTKGESCANCPEDCGECPPECGDGECNGDETCETCVEDCGECEVDCEALWTLGCNEEDSWDTAEGSAVVNAYDCVGGDYSANEYVYDFVAECDAPVTVTLTKGGETNQFLDLFVLTAADGCNGAACLTYDWMSENSAEVTFEATTGTAYYIVVDGYNGASAEYTISVSCDCGPFCGDGNCDPEENCASCPDDCGACGSSCCAAGEAPGCDDDQCVNVVCAVDPFCCETVWDGICASEAIELCPSCGGTLPGGNCCVEQDGATGCEDADCEAIVCAADDWCCEMEWDGICATEAQEMCASCGGVAPACGDGDCNGTENCESCPDDCGECCGDGECSAEFGEDCQTCEADCGACCGDNVCDADIGEDCQSCEADCGACCGDAVCDGEIGENCASCAADCGDCVDDCCVANGTPECENAVCTNVVCAADPFCCETEWDNLCAAGAADLCPTCGGALPGGNCCEQQEQGVTGCEVAECEAIVCAEDPYCCETNWDGICAAEAGELCAGCGGGGVAPACGDGECNGEETCVTCSDDCGLCDGDCCGDNGSIGCQNATCQELVCGTDPFCCHTEWDNLCADQAADVCVGCMDVGNCCDDGHGSGCVNQMVQDCVCALDPYCCETEWDAICVGEAQDECGANCELASFCGDDVCGDGEDCNNCEADCGACCGNGQCEADFGEDCTTCEVDCGSCCGDNVCDADIGEDCLSCQADCGACPATCEGKCGNAFDGDLPCQCDAICFEAGDCCQDICAECDTSTFPDECGAITTTCEFRCGEYDGAKDCQCDAVCFVENDCCGDVCTHCGDDYAQQCQ